MLVFFKTNFFVLFFARSTQLRSQRRCDKAFGILKPITCKTKQNKNYDICKCIYISISHKRNSTLKPPKSSVSPQGVWYQTWLFYWIYCSCWRHTLRIIGRKKAAKDFLFTRGFIHSIPSNIQIHYTSYVQLPFFFKMKIFVSPTAFQEAFSFG